MTHSTLDDRMAVLLAKAEDPYNEAIQQVCNSWLEMFPLRHEPSFLELSQPVEK